MLLSRLIFLPLLGALPLCFARDKNAREIKVWALVVALITFVVSLPLWMYVSVTGVVIYLLLYQIFPENARRAQFPPTSTQATSPAALRQ